MDFDSKDILLATVAVLMIGVSIFSMHYRVVLNDMFGLMVALMVPFFLIILALSIFAGPKVISFVGMPGIKPIFTFLLILMIFGAFSATLGNDINSQITGNSVKATDVIFTRETLNISVVMIVGVVLFFIVLGKSH